MNSVERTLSRAARRSLADRGQRAAGGGLVLGLAASALLLAADRLLNLELSWRYFVIGPGAGVVAGTVYALFSGPSRLTIARHLDHAMQLKDRIGTAKALEGAASNPIFDPAFVELARHNAQQLAESIDVRRAVPVRLTGIWWPAAALAVALACGFMFVPSLQRNTAAQSAASTPALTAAQRVAIDEQVKELSKSLDQALAQVPDSAAMDDSARSQLEALDRLNKQLSDPKTADEQAVSEARDESAARLNELADQIAERAARESDAAAALAQKFKGLDETGAPKPPLSAEQFSEALARGDFGEAARRLDELLSAPDLSEADRKATAEHLRRLAKDIEAAKDSPSEIAEPKRAALEKTLRQQGLDDDTIKRLLDENTPPDAAEQTRKELDKRGVDPDVAERIAAEAQAAREQQKLNDQVKRDSEEAGRSLDRAAEQIEHPDAVPQPPEQEDESSPTPPASQPIEDKPLTSPPASSKPATPEPQRPAPADKPQSHESAPKSTDAGKPSSQQSSPQSSQRQNPRQADAEYKPSTPPQQPVGPNGERVNSPAAPPTHPAAPESRPAQSNPSAQSRKPSSESPNPKHPDKSSQSNDATPATQAASQQRSTSTQQKPEPPSAQQKTQPDTASSPKDNAETQPSDASTGEPRQAAEKPNSPDSPNQSPATTSQKPDQSSDQSTSPEHAQPKPGTQTPTHQPNPKNDARNQPSDTATPKDQQSHPNPGEKQQASPQSAGEKPDASPSNPQPQQQSQPQPDAEGNKDQKDPQPSEIFRKLAERAGKAAKDQQVSEQLKKAAREIAENMTPEEREQWAKQWQREHGSQPPGDAQTDAPGPDTDDQRLTGGGPDAGNRRPAPRTNPPAAADPLATAGEKPVDLRGRESGDQVIAEWLTSQKPDAPRGPGSTDSADQRVRAAQDVAERAVNESAVQKRYHKTIKRYFGRLNETLGNAQNPAPPPAASPAASPPAAAPTVPAATSQPAGGG